MHFSNIFAQTKNNMELHKLIKMKAEIHAQYNGEQMDNTAYFSFMEGAKYAMELISKHLKDEA